MTDTYDQPEMTGKKRKSPVLLILLIVIIGLVAFTAFTLFQRFQMWAAMMTPPEAGPTSVIVTIVEPIVFADRIEAVGTAEADESTTISAAETEIIEKVMFEDGQFVKEGDLLVQLKDTEESATYSEALKAYNRYKALAENNAGSIARRDEAKAVMQVAWARVSDRKIKAPFDGILGIREVSNGDLVSPGTVITTIDDIDPMEVEFSVPEIYISELLPGVHIEARSEAYPGQIFEGSIKTVNPRIDPVTRSIRVKAEVENPESLLRPGLLMNVEIVKNSRTSLAVPEESLMSGAQGKTVVKVTQDGDNLVATPTPVTIGTRRAGYVEVTSGLTLGDTVITEGILKAQPGAPLAIAETRTIQDQINKALEQSNPTKQEELLYMTKENEPSDMESAPDITEESSEDVLSGEEEEEDGYRDVSEEGMMDDEEAQ